MCACAWGGYAVDGEGAVWCAWGGGGVWRAVVWLCSVCVTMCCVAGFGACDAVVCLTRDRGGGGVWGCGVWRSVCVGGCVSGTVVCEALCKEGGRHDVKMWCAWLCVSVCSCGVHGCVCVAVVCVAVVCVAVCV